MSCCQENIRNIRRNNNLSQEFIAFELGISQKAYSDIENGKTILKLEVLEKLSIILDTNLYDLCSHAHICDYSLKQENERLKKLLKENNIDFSY